MENCKAELKSTGKICKSVNGKTKLLSIMNNSREEVH